MSEVLIRDAVESDLADVLEMSKGLYGNHDYFPGEFLNFLNDPSRRILVAEKAGKAVGLQVIHIVDEGETAIVQGLRVHVKNRSQGIGKQLIQECRNYVKENFPQVKFERYSVNSRSIERLGIQKKSDDILFETIAYFLCVVNGNEQMTQPACCINLNHLNKAEFEDVLSTGKLDKILFKDKYIVNWQPFKALVSNGLLKDGDSIFASYSGESVESLSHSQWCPIEKCPQLFTVCYTQSDELLKAHVVKQLENAIQQHPGETFLFIPLVDTSLIDCASQFLLKDLSLQRLKDLGTEKFRFLYLFENRI